MFQVIVNCDRCHKFLPEGEGYQFQVVTRSYRTHTGTLVGSLDSGPTLAGEICEGCYNLMHFFFREKFREEPRPLAQ